MAARAMVLLLLASAAAHAGDFAERVHVVRVVTERSTVGGTTRSTLATPAIAVGARDGLLLAAGFHLEPPEDDEEAVRVEVRMPDGRVLRGAILGGDADLECTLFRIAPGQGEFPEPVPFDRPVVPVGAPVVLHGRHGERMDHASREIVAHVDAKVDRPHPLYALREPLQTWIGSVATTKDGKLVGFVDTRSTVREGGGLMMGVGADTLVVVPADVFTDIVRNPPGNTVARAWIGINLAPFDDNREDFFDVPDDWPGALVTGVAPGSPADEAGIRVHDLVQTLGPLALRFEKPSEWAAMLRQVQRLPLEKELACKIVRFRRRADGGYEHERLDVSLTLRERPVDFRDAPETEVPFLGVKVKPLTDDWRVEARVPAGVTGVVVWRTARAAAAQLGGVALGDLVMEVDGKPVVDVASFVALCEAARTAGRDKVVFFVSRGTQTLFLALPNRG